MITANFELYLVVITWTCYKNETIFKISDISHWDVGPACMYVCHPEHSDRDRNLHSIMRQLLLWAPPALYFASKQFTDESSTRN